MQIGKYRAIRVRRPQYIEEVDIKQIKDIQRIQNMLLDRGLYATSEQCKELWEMVSEDVCASWLVMPQNDADLYDEIKVYIEEVG